VDETTSTPNNDQPTADEERVKKLEAEAQNAKEALLHAREQLRHAEKTYCEAEQRLRDEREGELPPYQDAIEHALTLVRKHPGIGLTAAAAVGFVVGRILRRW
jgi:ElaB/YqjD/DUF883 family membrane-anchored ribosome-binding protein